MQMQIVNPLLSPPPPGGRGVIYLKHIWGEGGLIIFLPHCNFIIVYLLFLYITTE